MARDRFSFFLASGAFTMVGWQVFQNIGMTLGIVPVIGIPLPFISYGGSSLWAYTILLFIFIRQDGYHTTGLILVGGNNFRDDGENLR